ncbi:hypothetical protein Htur_4082 (plasmid) [Haloterrigena turkmenica DSM 5511]|uniref:Halobacterial output domain-containing protein n=1 Tax=Haloterrigena turkmenica (strain ATCC 51198 / DSM 5511 / JCM 9101 / NCIMB 13204 / VKM B-1734 / 4k) TaxID=543526 RepID=D2S0M0_HALTV|nr:HalOD1 output domain-containing protein [Haloterrigena turkmenica]ADB62917.1 hypothetical protein Htur_4082 [Haloterrigena turkmenica DSM 5511]
MSIPSSVEDGIFYDTTTDTFHARFNPEQTNPSKAVILALAEVTRTDLSKMEPLFSEIDPNALDTILGSHLSETATEARKVTFQYQNHLVFVTGSGTLTVFPEVQEQTLKERRA